MVVVASDSDVMKPAVVAVGDFAALVEGSWRTMTPVNGSGLVVPYLGCSRRLVG